MSRLRFELLTHYTYISQRIKGDVTMVGIEGAVIVLNLLFGGLCKSLGSERSCRQTLSLKYQRITGCDGPDASPIGRIH